MQVCKKVLTYLYMYVGVHACMCVRLANDFIKVKTETNQLICCEEIPTFYFIGKLYFYCGYKFYRGNCFICLIGSNGTAACRLTQSV